VDKRQAVEIPIPLRQHASGLKGIYRDTEGKFWEAVDAGRRVVLRIAAPAAAEQPGSNAPQTERTDEAN